MSRAEQYLAQSASRARGTLRAIEVEVRARRQDLAGSERAEREADTLLHEAGAVIALLQFDVHRGMARLAADDKIGAERILARAEGQLRVLGLLPESLLVQEVRRLRRAIRRAEVR